MNGFRLFLTLLSVVCIAVQVSFAHPGHGNRTKRGAAATGAGVVGLPLFLGIPAILNTFECGHYGCHKGYCWAYCGISLSGGDWCYTTRGYSQDYRYVRCGSDDDCNGCWKCAASCTL